MQIAQMKGKSIQKNFHVPRLQSQSVITLKPTGNQSSPVPVLMEIPDFYK